MTKPSAIESSPNKRRFTNVDQLRGLLIVLVMLGHIVLGSVHDNVIRYSIYAFHMPVFIALTGYLINAESLKKQSFLSVFSRYWWRVILPFGFAYAFYTGILSYHAYQEGRITFKLLMSYAHTPYYHLWFIPTLVLWVLGFAAALKLRLPFIFLLISCVLLSIIWAAVPKADLGGFLAPFLSKKVIYFFSFFLFGAWLKMPSSKRFRKLLADFRVLPIAIALFCALPYLFNIGADKTLLKSFAWLILNLSLISVLIQYAVSAVQSKPSIISEIGRNSLPIYLWHMLPLFILKGFDIHQSHTLVYYLLGSLGMLLIVWGILKLESRNKFIDRCLFGINNA